MDFLVPRRMLRWNTFRDSVDRSVSRPESLAHDIAPIVVEDVVLDDVVVALRAHQFVPAVREKIGSDEVVVRRRVNPNRISEVVAVAGVRADEVDAIAYDEVVVRFAVDVDASPTVGILEVTIT